MKKSAYESMIMSWSCFGDFVLVAQTMQTLVDKGIIRQGVIISHQAEFKYLLNSTSIQVLYPTRSLKDFIYLTLLCFKKNIFVLQDMPSHNRFTRELRLAMAFFLTRRFGSKLFLLIDLDFQKTFTTVFAKALATRTAFFDKKTQVHLSQYMLDLLYKVSIIPSLICTYTLLPEIRKPAREYGEKYIAIHPFAGGNGKSPSIEWWRTFLYGLSQVHPDYRIILTGGPADKQKVKEIIQGLENTISTCGDLTFKETIYVLKNANLMISVDTGPMHYAALFGVKQVLFWMHSNYTYMPVFNASAYILNGNKVFTAKEIYMKDHTFVKNIDLNQVMETVRKQLA